MYVIKADGRKEDFNEDKIIKACRRAGVSNETARSIVRKIRATFPDGTTTHKIYLFMLDELDRAGDAGLFTLRESVANLDPVSFELFVKKVLEAHGYKCSWDRLVKGKYVEHQVDVFASGDKNYVVECKRHFNPHRFTGLGIVLQVEARLVDIKAGTENGLHADAAWIVTNTKFSEHAKQYAHGTGVRLTGWRYEEPFSLEHMIQAKKVLPVTVLKTDVSVHRLLLRKKIITLGDLIKQKPNLPNIRELLAQSKTLLNKL